MRGIVCNREWRLVRDIRWVSKRASANTISIIIINATAIASPFRIPSIISSAVILAISVTITIVMTAIIFITSMFYYLAGFKKFRHRPARESKQVIWILAARRHPVKLRFGVSFWMCSFTISFGFVLSGRILFRIVSSGLIFRFSYQRDVSFGSVFGFSDPRGLSF